VTLSTPRLTNAADAVSAQSSAHGLIFVRYLTHRPQGLLDLSLSNVDIMIKTSGNQTAALEELKKVAKENSDDMSRVVLARIQ
jgi:hypothetical protein